jgi:hypothetical protein
MDKILKELKEKESYIRSEVYRVFKNAIKDGVIYTKDTYKEVFVEILPEVSIIIEKGRIRRADLVAYSQQFDKVKPRLVIETKQRALEQPGKSFANFSKKTNSYAEKLDVWHYVVYDGYYYFLFSRLEPYLIKGLTVEPEIQLNEEFAKTVLLTVAEISYTSEKRYFKELDKYPLADKGFIKRKILPSLAKSFDLSKWNELLTKWEEQM